MTKHNDLPPLTQDILFGIKEGLFEDKVGRVLFHIWEAGVCDDRIRGMIEHRVRKARHAMAFRGVPFRTPRMAGGDLMLGLDDAGQRIYVPTQYLNAHSLMLSGTGGGKTTRTCFYALQIASRVKGCWLIDLRKREFRRLQPLLARLQIDLTVLPARSMRINPLQVPLGVDPTEWVPRIAEMLVQVLDLPPRASKLVQTTLFRLYRRFGVFAGAQAYPTLFDLLEAIKRDTDSNPHSRRALIDSIEPILCSLGPEVLAYRYGWPPHELARRHLAIELGGVGETDQNLILNYLLLSEFTSRIARGISNARMDLWIACDEAQRLCSAGNGRSSAIEDLIGLIRGTGIGLDLSIQSAATVSPAVASNTATKFLGRCNRFDDYATFGHSIGLNAEQIQWAQHHLTPGLFIGQVAEGAWRYPFVFRVPPMQLLPPADPSQATADPEPLPDLPSLTA